MAIVLSLPYNGYTVNEKDFVSARTNPQLEFNRWIVRSS
jgi:hypothetical protein